MNTPDQTRAINWDELSRHGKLRAVIDPNDVSGFKNILIDRVHWAALRPQLHHSKAVLDLGCGTGRFAPRIKAMGLIYVGIDSSQGMIEAAQEWHKGLQVTFQHFDGQKIPLADSSFDTVIASRVFMHLLKTPAGENLLAEVRRVLKPGGHFILLEEASMSGKKSGQAPRVLHEEDFTSALIKHFEIKDLYKVRSSEFSKMSRRITEWGTLPYPVFRLVLAPLTAFELCRVRKKPMPYFTAITYYDFLIHAVLREK
jgi:SAM-dependent methyltransferase